MTSVGGDESNIGFLLSNQRTKETKYYPCAGATEYSAMDSAEGQVQNLRYNATFPLLLNVAEQPTYFMALKDASELVKMYAMVNVNQYQIVATGATLADCEANYRQMLLKNNPSFGILYKSLKCMRLKFLRDINIRISMTNSGGRSKQYRRLIFF